MNIDYRKVAAALDYYWRLGYEYIDVPWLVSSKSMAITSPPDAKLFETFAGCCVASGEQSLLEMRGQLIPGKRYVCATPCYRDDPPDKLHRQTFFKVELMTAQPENAEYELVETLEAAAGFFRQYGRPVRKSAPGGIDLEINGVEVGSYGIRSYKDFRWVYGTGCAEPRLSQALQEK